MEEDIELIYNYILNNMDILNVELSEGYYYQSLPFCVADAVFSIGAHYTSTKNTVKRFACYFEYELIRANREGFPEAHEQIPISTFVNKIDELSIVYFAENVFMNMQKTSTRNGILKAEAVYLFSKVLKGYEVERFQNLSNILNNSDFEKDIKEIKGQGSGISLRYFYMLAGEENYLKPDRMLFRFTKTVLSRDLTEGELIEIMTEVKDRLLELNPQITLRKLYHLVWNYQRNQ